MTFRISELDNLKEAALAEFEGNSPTQQWAELTTKMRTALKKGATTEEFASSLGLETGVTGFVLHSVPVAVYASLRHPDSFRDAITSALACGGDTDSVAAITGALSGALVGPAAIPPQWLSGIKDWPRGVGLLTDLAERLTVATKGGDAKPRRYAWPFVPMRNVLFLATALLHGFRRLLPPY